MAGGFSRNTGEDKDTHRGRETEAEDKSETGSISSRLV